MNSYREHGAIKHCPRCGARGRIMNHRPEWEIPMYACGCGSNLTQCFESPEFETKREAVEWWNMRPKRRKRRIDPQ